MPRLLAAGPSCHAAGRHPPSVNEISSGKGSSSPSVARLKKSEEGLKKAADGNQFVEGIVKIRSELLKSQTTLAAAQGKGAVLGFTVTGDTAKAAEAERDAALEAIRLTSKARHDDIITTEKDMKVRATLLANLETETTQLRLNATREYYITRNKLEADAAKAQLDLWQKETEALITEYGKRIKLRRDQITRQGGFGGRTTTAGPAQSAIQ